MLSISEERFNELYPYLVGHYDFFNSSPSSPEEFEKRYLVSKLWRLNNLYTIVDKYGEPVKFVMNEAQHIVYAATRVHPRVIILKSRQQGISTLWLVSYFDDAIFAPFLNLGLMAQGTDEAASLLERAKTLWDYLCPDVKNFLGITLEKDNTKQFAFSNKSTIFIRVSFRSTTLQRLHISEMGKIANTYPKRAKEVKTGTLQALAPGNTGVIESTGEGKNMFKEMWDDAMLTFKTGAMAPKDFYPVFLSWLNDPDCVSDVDQTITEEAEKYFQSLPVEPSRQQKNFWIIQQRELGGDIFQEYPATPEEAFTASKDGTYFSRAFNEYVVRKNRVIPNLFDKNLPVDVYFDLGVDDYTVLVFVQWYNKEWRIIHEYFNNGYSLRHYMEYVVNSGYSPRSLRFPHDIRVRELGAAGAGGKAKSRYDIVLELKKELNLNSRIDTLPKSSVVQGIESVRRMIPELKIDPSCEYIISCLQQYSKEWDDKLDAWKPTPLHDVYSHGADVLRQIAANTSESYNANRSALDPLRPSRSRKSFDI